MPRNIEIKARVDNFRDLCHRAREASDSGGPTAQLVQRDVFFATTQDGQRLKLRYVREVLDDEEVGDKEVPETTAKLIAYSRPDKDGPKMSDYRITVVEDGEGLEETLLMALGKKGEVRKTRFLYMVDQTRIHCDKVDDLGAFAELEVCLRDDQTEDEGVAIARELMEKLGIVESDLVSGAYMDLILEDEASGFHEQKTFLYRENYERFLRIKAKMEKKRRKAEKKRRKAEKRKNKRKRSSLDQDELERAVKRVCTVCPEPSSEEDLSQVVGEMNSEDMESDCSEVDEEEEVKFYPSSEEEKEAKEQVKEDSSEEEYQPLAHDEVCDIDFSYLYEDD